MSPMIDFTEDDLNRGKIVEPAWYRMTIGHLTEALSKNGDSTNWVYEDSKIIRNEETNDEKFAGVIIPIRFNSKAKGFTTGFLTVLLGEEVKPGVRYDMKAAEGKEIVAFVENDTYENRLVNRINHKYKAAK